MKNKHIYLGLLCILVYMLPYIVLGENSYITIHDYLDQDVAIMAILKNLNIMTTVNGIVPNMDGLSRTLFEAFTPFNIKLMCYEHLPIYWAVIVYTFIIKCISFIGMFLLVDNYLFEKKYRLVTTGLALGLAIVPSYVLHELSGIGLPLLIYAFLNLYNSKQQILSYLLIVLYAFNSMLAYGGFFIMVILFIIVCYDFYKNKRICKRLIFGMALMCFIYAISNWGTIYSMFFSSSFVSHRSEWVVTSTIKEDLMEFVNLLLCSNYHAGRILAAPILLLFGYFYFQYRKKYKFMNGIATLYILIITGFLIGKLLKYTHIQLFVEIQFDRFYFFYPSVCLIMLAACCCILLKENKNIQVYILVLYGLFAPTIFDTELKINLKQLLGMEIKSPNYKRFYDTKLFTKLMDDLNIKPDYTSKVVSIGMYPAIAEYNGFYTIDSYRVNYPVEYKHKFRKVIEKEIEKNEDIREYFDGWGSRCYIFSSELYELGKRFMCGKNENISLENLEINVRELKELGCEYILSSVDIKNYETLDLIYLNSYTNDDSYWNIRVYQIK